MDQQVVYRYVRHIEIERRPVRAAVDRHMNAAFVAGEEEPRVARMFAQPMNRRLRQAGDDRAPRLAEVVADVDVRAIVVVVVPVERRVHATGGMPRWQHAAHVRIRRQRGHAGRHVGPLQPAVSRDVQLPVIAAGVEHSRIDRRLADRRQRRKRSDTVVSRQRAI